MVIFLPRCSILFSLSDNRIERARNTAVGLCVRIGSAPTGDDALAMSAAAKFKIGIQWVYLTTDFIVLALSVSYIPLKRLAYSLLTVLLSGQLIGFIEKFQFRKSA